ncbi:hypothetical protein PanWU01x14_126180 [Parasponia andersonii]|uniref:Uncharacterized protein n=1 Tax=Parasponia andersonii TaxID=3476 RepID=A0A2P5CTD6_PARAD|nr:hypothetical protein PanWU01x14_126180 [Parasponia andersonii]
MPSVWRLLLFIILVCQLESLTLLLEDFLTCYWIKENQSDSGRYLFVYRKNQQLIEDHYSNDKGFKGRYFFVLQEYEFGPNEAREYKVRSSCGRPSQFANDVPPVTPESSIRIAKFKAVGNRDAQKLLTEENLSKSSLWSLVPMIPISLLSYFKWTDVIRYYVLHKQYSPSLILPPFTKHEQFFAEDVMKHIPINSEEAKARTSARRNLQSESSSIPGQEALILTQSSDMDNSPLVLQHDHFIDGVPSADDKEKLIINY